MGALFWGEIEETIENICGVIDYDKHAFFITCTEDDQIDREYTTHKIYDDKSPDTVCHFKYCNYGGRLRLSPIPIIVNLGKTKIVLRLI